MSHRHELDHDNPNGDANNDPNSDPHGEMKDGHHEPDLEHDHGHGT